MDEKDYPKAKQLLFKIQNRAVNKYDYHLQLFNLAVVSKDTLLFYQEMKNLVSYDFYLKDVFIEKSYFIHDFQDSLLGYYQEAYHYYKIHQDTALEMAIHKMDEKDLYYRKQINQLKGDSTQLNDRDSLLNLMTAQDERNQQSLDSIILIYHGIPGLEVLNTKDCYTIFRVIQHTIPISKRKYYTKLLLKNKEHFPSRSIATIIDRTYTKQNRSSRFNFTKKDNFEQLNRIQRYFTNRRRIKYGIGALFV